MLDAFINLHNHSDYSILDGYSHPHEYLKQAALLGQPAVGLTDHGNIFGAFEFISDARNLSRTVDKKLKPQTPIFVKPIVGMEAYVAPENPLGAKVKTPIFYSNNPELKSLDVSMNGAYTHLTLLAYNDEGFHNLIKLATESFKRENVYYNQRIDFSMLQKWHDGLIATTGCPSGEIQTRLRLGQKREAYEYAERMRELFGDYYFVELMDHHMANTLESNIIPQLLKLGQDLRLPLLATNDAHYARACDAKHHDEMLCIQTNSRGGEKVFMDTPTEESLPAWCATHASEVSELAKKGKKPPVRFSFSGSGYYLRTRQEMLNLFPNDAFPNAVNNTMLVNEMVGDWWLTKDNYEANKQHLVPVEGVNAEPKIVEANKGVTVLYDSARSVENTSVSAPISSTLQALVDKRTVQIGCYDLSLNHGLRPIIPIPDGYTEDSWFKHALKEGFNTRRRDAGDSEQVLEESRKRVEAEYPVFKNNDFIQYMLVVQDYINWARHNNVSVGVGRGCFLANAHITMGDNSRKLIRDVKTNDMVLTHDGTIQRVVKRFEYHVENELVVKVTLNDGSVFTCTADHMLLSKMDGFIPASKLKPNMSILGPKFNFANLAINVKAAWIFKALQQFSGTFTSYQQDKLQIPYNTRFELAALTMFETDSRVKSFNKIDTIKGFVASYRVTYVDGNSTIVNLSGLHNVDSKIEGQTILTVWNVYHYAIIRHDYKRVRKVETYKYSGHVYDLQVENVHNYIVNGITAHNSVGGSEVAYLMDISRTDPIKHDLLFERFLNPERVSPPDVDTDFKASTRNKVLQYVKGKYGESNVANIINFGTFKLKQAFTDVAKIYHMDAKTCVKLSKLIPDLPDHKEPTMGDLYDPKSDFYAPAKDFRDAIASGGPAWANIKDSTAALVGRVRQTGVHACGVIMSSKPIVDYAPLVWEKNEQKAKENPWTDCMVAWKYQDLEALGLIKMDFLPLSTLDIIDGTIKIVKDYNSQLLSLIKSCTDPKLADTYRRMMRRVPDFNNIENVGMTDEATFKMLAEGDSDAVFQLGSDGQKDLLKRIKPDCFDDLVAINALYRPGPMGMNAHIKYANRKNGLEPIFVVNEELNDAFKGTPVETILKNTYEIICFQEQIMEISRLLCGYSRGQADSLRKAMGHKVESEMIANHKRFVDGAMMMAGKNGWHYTREDVEKLWLIIEKFSEYAFNRSHSVSYAINAYETAFLKRHYTPFFWAANLTLNAKERDKLSKYVLNVRKMGLKIGPVSINKSGVGVTVNVKTRADDYDIMFGLDMAKGVNSTLAENIVACRIQNGGKYGSFDEFMTKGPDGILSKTVIQALAVAGAFDEYNISRRAIVEQAESIVKFYTLKRKGKKGRKLSGSLFSLNGDTSIGKYDFNNTNNISNSKSSTDLTLVEYDYLTKARMEYDSLSIYASTTPLNHAGAGLNYYKNTPRGYCAKTISQILAKISESAGKISKTTENSNSGGYKPIVRPRVRLVAYMLDIVKRVSSKGTNWWRMTLADDTGTIPAMLFDKAAQVIVQHHNTVSDMSGMLNENVVYDLECEVDVERNTLIILKLSVIPLEPKTGKIPLFIKYDSSEDFDRMISIKRVLGIREDNMNVLNSRNVGNFNNPANTNPTIMPVCVDFLKERITRIVPNLYVKASETLEQQLNMLDASGRYQILGSWDSEWQRDNYPTNI